MSLKDFFKKKSKNENKTEDATFSELTSEKLEASEGLDSLPNESGSGITIETDIGDKSLNENTSDFEKELMKHYKEDKKSVSKKEGKKSNLGKFNLKKLFTKKEIEISTKEEDFERKTVDSDSNPDEDKVSKKTNTASAMSEASFEAKKKIVPLLGKFEIKVQYRVASSVFVLALAGVITGVALNNSSMATKTEAVNLATKMTGDFEAFGSSFNGATVGRKGEIEAAAKAFEELKKNVNELREYNKKFSEANFTDLKDVESSLSKEMEKIQLKMNVMKANEDLLKNTAERVEKVQLGISEMTDLLDKLGIILIQMGASQTEVANVYYIKTALNSISSDISTLFFAEDVPPDTLVTLEKTRKEVRRTLSETYFGDKAKNVSPISYGAPFATYKAAVEKWIKLADAVDSIQKRGGDLIKIHKLASENRSTLSAINKNMDSVLKFYGEHDYAKANTGISLLIGSTLLLLLSVGLILLINSYERENKMMQEKMENSRNQGAILKLLNEMIPLQDGDLTQRVTVSEDITATIADSINATIDSLSALVKKITDTSMSMREKTSSVNMISLELLNNAEKQSKEISETGSSVIDISKAVKEISNKTFKGAEQAMESAKISSKGAEQVFESIETMQSINKNILETAHLMKKVSDSSKQISEIVSLLSDITEETNILALNATVQASKAGESGKGFKVVADSIQELADTAADATRRVGALISAVQTDIQSVSSSVEVTAQEVSKGVQLSEYAGESLNMIKAVSNELAKAIEDVSSEALKHAKVSEQISKNMEVILDATEKAKSSTEKTAGSIAEIADLSTELGESVQSFKI